MIKLFRNIRQTLLAENKLSKYLLYAIGEIILVVIGILIAISINNWNENKKDMRKERDLYSKVVLDLDKEMILIEEALDLFKSHEDLHYHLFNVKNKKDQYNSEMSYGALRWHVPFEPTFKDNYQAKIDEITNDSIREAINEYFRYEQRAVNQKNDFRNLKVNMVRPYITSNGLVRAEDIYVEKRYKEVDTKNSIDLDALSTKFDSPEFDQLLYELKVKTVSAIVHLEFLMEANRNLRKKIDNTLNTTSDKS